MLLLILLFLLSFFKVDATLPRTV